MPVPIGSLKNNLVDDSQPHHQITTATFQENTIKRRLKGIAIFDPDKRDQDHPSMRKDHGDIQDKFELA